MNVVISVFGSRGDVQPVAGLGLALQKRGHRVTLCAPENFADWSRRIGLRFVPIGSDILRFFERTDVGVFRMTRALRAELAGHFDPLTDVVRGADLVLGSGVPVAAHSVADLCGVPYRFVAFCPLSIRSAQHPPPHFFKLRRLSAAIPALWGLSDGIFNFAGAEVINAFRRRSGLPEIRGVWDHVVGRQPLLAADPALAPLPADLASDVFQTGTWSWNPDAPADNEAQASLETFLQKGPPPIYVGFGSMPVGSASALAQVVRAAIAKTDGRAVVSVPAEARAGLSESDELHWIGDVPHAALFPRTLAVVHHGGAGTTATAARSGVPQIIVPHMLDQHYWGHRVAELGLGPLPIARRRLSERTLVEALACVQAPAVRERALALGATMRTDGIDQAIRHLEGLMPAVTSAEQEQAHA